MILIVSQNQEPSTDKVISWLSFYGKPFKRINGDDFYNLSYNYSFNLSNDANSPKISLGDVLLNKYDSIFYRRWISLNFKFRNELNDFKKLENVSYSDIKRHFSNELIKSYKPIFDFLTYGKVKMLPEYKSRNVNKIDVLIIAKSIGLNIPDSLITNNKSELISFYKKHKQIINKPISEVLSFRGNDYFYYMRTNLVKMNDIEKIDDKFFPSLFQNYINKYLEIRSFFLENTFYSMAIFSQDDKKTEIDFRNYNDKEPNRTVPFKIPNNIQNKLIKLMDKLNLNTGSIDLILTPNNEFYFLEVNPVGQYDMTSVPCNYFLDKKIANIL